MKVLLKLAIIVCCAWSASVSAADISVAIVDVAKLQKEVPQINRLRERIALDFQSREERLATQQAQIAKLETELVKGATDPESKKLQRDIRSRKLRLENAQEELASDRRLRTSEEMDRLRRVLAEVIAEVATSEGLDIVLESGVTWASARANITDKVLARMRELDAAAE